MEPELIIHKLEFQERLIMMSALRMPLWSNDSLLLLGGVSENLRNIMEKELAACDNIEAAVDKYVQVLHLLDLTITNVYPEMYVLNNIDNVDLAMQKIFEGVEDKHYVIGDLLFEARIDNAGCAIYKGICYDKLILEAIAEKVGYEVPNTTDKEFIFSSSRRLEPLSNAEYYTTKLDTRRDRENLIRSMSRKAKMNSVYATILFVPGKERFIHLDAAATTPKNTEERNDNVYSFYVHYHNPLCFHFHRIARKMLMHRGYVENSQSEIHDAEQHAITHWSTASTKLEYLHSDSALRKIQYYRTPFGGPKTYESDAPSLWKMLREIWDISDFAIDECLHSETLADVMSKGLIRASSPTYMKQTRVCESYMTLTTTDSLPSRDNNYHDERLTPNYLKLIVFIGSILREKFHILIEWRADIINAVPLLQLINVLEELDCDVHVRTAKCDSYSDDADDANRMMFNAWSFAIRKPRCKQKIGKVVTIYNTGDWSMKSLEYSTTSILLEELETQYFPAAVIYRFPKDGSTDKPKDTCYDDMAEPNITDPYIIETVRQKIKNGIAITMHNDARQCDRTIIIRTRNLTDESIIRKLMMAASMGVRIYVSVSESCSIPKYGCSTNLTVLYTPDTKYPVKETIIICGYDNSLPHYPYAVHVTSADLTKESLTMDYHFYHDCSEIGKELHDDIIDIITTSNEDGHFSYEVK